MELVFATTFAGFLIGFVAVLCVGNYYRAKRAADRQRLRRLEKQEQQQQAASMSSLQYTPNGNTNRSSPNISGGESGMSIGANQFNATQNNKHLHERRGGGPSGYSKVNKTPQQGDVEQLVSPGFMSV
jgi:hypothetical protein